MADSVEDVYKDTESRMNKALESTRSEFAAIRTGRASTALLDRLHVEAYGASVPLKQVASVSTPDARSLVVTAFDRGTVGAIRKAIETSDLGLTPNVDGSTIRLSIPPLTEERRKDLVKVVRKKGEDGKVAIRNVRHKMVDELKTLQKDTKIKLTEDAIKRAQDQIQKLTDRFHQRSRHAGRTQRERDHGSLMETSASDASVIMERESLARRALAGRPLRLRMLVPPYPAFGVGTLRVLRIREHEPYLEVVAGYERYERRDG